MRRDADVHVEVAVGTAAPAGVAVTRQPQPGAVGNAGGDANHHRFAPHRVTVPGARRATPLTFASAAAAGRAVAREHHVPARPAYLPRALALLTDATGRRHFAGAIAVAAWHPPREHQLTLGAAQRLLEREADAGVKVGAGLLWAGFRQRMQDVSEQFAEC